MAKHKVDAEEAQEPNSNDAEELQENFNDDYSQISDNVAKGLREADKERGPAPTPSKK